MRARASKTIVLASLAGAILLTLFAKTLDRGPLLGTASRTFVAPVAATCDQVLDELARWHGTARAQGARADTPDLYGFVASRRVGFGGMRCLNEQRAQRETDPVVKQRLLCKNQSWLSDEGSVLIRMAMERRDLRPQITAKLSARFSACMEAREITSLAV